MLYPKHQLALALLLYGYGVLVNPSRTLAQPTFEPQELATQLQVGYAVRALDINRDQQLDIVAVGRATHKVKIYWNQLQKK